MRSGGGVQGEGVRSGRRISGPLRGTKEMRNGLEGRKEGGNGLESDKVVSNSLTALLSERRRAKARWRIIYTRIKARAKARAFNAGLRPSSPQNIQSNND
jgi:hypothetical protein